MKNNSSLSWVVISVIVWRTNFTRNIPATSPNDVRLAVRMNNAYGEWPGINYHEEIPTIHSISIYSDTYTHMRIMYIMLNRASGHIVMHMLNYRVR